jgi:hypothetical protein
VQHEVQQLTHGGQLVDLRGDFCGEAQALHVAAAQPTLAQEALGDAVEGDELQGQIAADCTRVRMRMMKGIER